MKRSMLIPVALMLVACTDAPVTGTTEASVRFDAVMTAVATEAVLPSAYASIMGETNNTFPHSVKNLRYQQVFAGSDVVNPEIIGLCLRRDDVSGGGTSTTQTLAIKLGPTSLDYTNLGSNFASNYSGTPTEVFSGNVVVPAGTSGGITTDFDLCIPFSQTYNHPAGSNLIVEVVNTSLVSGNVPRDACSGTAATCTTTRAFAFSPTAENAVLVARGGLVMKFVSPEPPEPVEPPQPLTHEDCFKGGWTDFGFRNQGQCVRFVETGVDSRI
jgi:hypothetical protein